MSQHHKFGSKSNCQPMVTPFSTSISTVTLKRAAIDYPDEDNGLDYPNQDNEDHGDQDHNVCDDDDNQIYVSRAWLEQKVDSIPINACDGDEVGVSEEDSLEERDLPNLDTDFWDMESERIDEFDGMTSLTTDLSYIVLHQFLTDIGAPIHAFDSILRLLKREADMNGFSITAKHPRRETLLNKMINQYSTSGMKPTREVVDIEHLPPPAVRYDNQPIPRKVDTAVYYFDAQSAISELLGTPNLFSDVANLAVPPENPFGRCPSGQPLGESTTGSWYQEAYDNMFERSGGTGKYGELDYFLLPLVLYMDKTGVTIMQRHGLEPVMLTTIVLNEKARNKTDLSWRHLGFIPDLDQKSRAAKDIERGNPIGKGMSCRNYHACLEVVLRSLHVLQAAGGFTHRFTLGSVTKTVRVWCPVAFIIGDTKSQDNLCCRVANYQEQPRTCYACYTSFEDLSSETSKCRYVTQKEQWDLLDGCMEPGRECDATLALQLKETSTIRCFSNAMFKLNFGGSVFGQFGACALDMMHCFRSGVMRYIALAFISPMLPKQREQVDTMISSIMRGQRCRGMCSGLRTNFTKGVTNCTLLTANEWAGLLLAYLIINQTYQGAIIIESRFDDKEKDWAKHVAKRNKTVKEREEEKERRRRLKADRDKDVHPDDSEQEAVIAEEDDIDPHEARCTRTEFVQILEQILCYEALSSLSPTHWRQGDALGERKYDKAMRVMLKQLTSTLSRGGLGWQLAKVHTSFRHAASTIAKFGRLSNCDAEVGERGLKVWAKKPARRTNKQKTDTFTSQTSERVFESGVFRKAQASMERDDDDDDDNDTEPEDSSDSEQVLGPLLDQLEKKKACALKREGLQGNPKFVISYNHSFTEPDPGVEPTRHDACTAQCQWQGTYVHKSLVALPQSMVECFANAYFGNLPGAVVTDEMKQLTIDGYTECLPDAEDGVVYRAHPNFMSAGPWYDWAIIGCPNGNQDLQRNPDVGVINNKSHDDEVAPTVPGKTKSGSNCRAPQYSYCTRKYGRFHVPCKILCFFRCPLEGVELAIVHACRPWMQKNYDRSSAISESWHLQMLEEQIGNRRRNNLIPAYNIVDAADLIEQISVYEETPGIHTSLPDEEYSGHVIFVTDRSTNWAQEFM